VVPLGRDVPWYRSPDYAEALRYRDAALSRDLILVQGVEPTA
jgi:uncharacterized protein (DUF1330 family)